MSRRGFVLAAVLFALVLLAALTAGGFFASLQEARTGRNALALVRADAATGSSIASIIAAWDPRIMNALPDGGSLVPATPGIPGVSVAPDVRRLSPRFFLIRADARTTGSVGRTAGAVVRLRGLDLDRAAARVRFIDAPIAASVSGTDQAPPGWTCPATTDTVPPVIVQPGASDSAFFQFGDRDWASLVSWAGAIGPGGDSLGVLLVAGNHAVAGSRVRGTLIVGGDLTLSGGAEIAGIVIVKGSVFLSGSGGTVRGSLISSQVVGVQGFMPSQALVVYSSCAVFRSGLSRAFAEPIPGLPRVPFW